MEKTDLYPRVRPTAILIEDGKILIIKQEVSRQRHWSLPGGALEYGETIEQCLVRETKEETGIDIKLKELLYITDRFRRLDHHIVHISFLVERVGDSPPSDNYRYKDTGSGDEGMIREVRFIPVDELTNYGFSPAFYRLVKDDFPGRASYQGEFHKFYGET